MPVVSTAQSTQLPQELVEHYAQAISILDLHLEKGQEQLTADAMRAKEALDSILTLITHPSAGFTPIGLAAVANGIKATLAPLTHLEGLGDALVEANEDWQPVIERAIEVNSHLSDYYARLQEKQP